MPEYGTQPTGFVRKPLDVILGELEAENVETFGPGVIQTPESPLGQINGLYAHVTAILWELAEDTYQSYDPDQAEGTRLDTLAKLRIVARAVAESDTDLRAGITNQGRARTDITDLIRALLSISEVTYVAVFVNDTDAPDVNGIAGHSVAVAILGGDDDTIARTLRTYIVPGIGMYGNTRVDTTIDGFCRTVWFIRPALVPIRLVVTVRTYTDKMGCPPPSTATIATALAEDLMGDERLRNGSDVTEYVIRQAVESRWSNIEFVSAEAARGEEDPMAPLPHAIAFDEIATFAPDDIQVLTAA